MDELYAAYILVYIRKFTFERRLSCSSRTSRRRRRQLRRRLRRRRSRYYKIFIEEILKRVSLPQNFPIYFRNDNYSKEANEVKEKQEGTKD